MAASVSDTTKKPAAPAAAPAKKAAAAAAPRAKPAAESKKRTKKVTQSAAFIYVDTPTHHTQTPTHALTRAFAHTRIRTHALKDTYTLAHRTHLREKRSLPSPTLSHTCGVFFTFAYLLTRISLQPKDESESEAEPSLLLSDEPSPPRKKLTKVLSLPHANKNKIPCVHQSFLILSTPHQLSANKKGSDSEDDAFSLEEEDTLVKKPAAAAAAPVKKLAAAPTPVSRVLTLASDDDEPAKPATKVRSSDCQVTHPHRPPTSESNKQQAQDRKTTPRAHKRAYAKC